MGFEATAAFLDVPLAADLEEDRPAGPVVVLSYLETLKFVQTLIEWASENTCFQLR